MKIDTTTIAGYADMTPEQKLAALEGYEVADPDYSGYVKKDVFDRTASELSKLKKDAQAKMTADELANATREEELQKLRDRNAELERMNNISSYKTRYLAMGYDEALAQETAEAWADGNHEKVIANQAAWVEAHDKRVKAGLLGGVTTPPAGSGTKQITKDDIMAVKDAGERQRLIIANPELF